LEQTKLTKVEGETTDAMGLF